MRVGILGSGLMGGKLGTLFARAGHEVVFSYARSKEKLNRLARDAGRSARANTPKEAAQGADAVLLAVHWSRIDDVLNQTGDLSGMDGKRVAHQKVECRLSEVVRFLAPYKKRLEQVAVESTYNWYWLVDGLQALRYPVVLANPAGMEQYSGIKHADDTNDAFFLAELLRLKILPTGYIYDPQLRPVRDLLRRRLTLVHQRTALMLSFKSLYTRTTGQEMTLSRLKELEIKEAQVPCLPMATLGIVSWPG